MGLAISNQFLGDAAAAAAADLGPHFVNHNIRL